MQQNTLGKFIRDSVILFVGVLLAGFLVSGITYDTTSTLILVAVVLSLFNLFLKPLLVVFALPFVIMTMGIGLWIINAALFYFAGQLIEGFGVASFGTALLGALIVSLTSLCINLLLSPRPNVRWNVQVNRNISRADSMASRRRKIHRKKDDDVIDI